MLTPNLPDSLASRILHIGGISGLRAFGTEWVASGELSAFEIRVLRAPDDNLALLACAGEKLYPPASTDDGSLPAMSRSSEACAEDNGTWAFPLGEDEPAGLMRVRFCHAPDAEQVERLQAVAGALYTSVRQVLDQERLHELERSVTLLQEQARQAEQLKEEFLSNLSHELRTPLTAMLGFAEILMEREELQPQNRVCVGRIRDNGDRLLTLLNRLIQLAKLQADRANVFIAPAELAELIHGAASRLRSSAEAKNLQVVHGSEAVLLDTDARLLAQVLDCVLENAVKFTDLGTISLHGYVEGDDVRIEVEDTGQGIDTGALPFVFDAFWQGDGSMTRAVGGNGIGLALASRLVSRLGGNLDIDSKRGRGTLVQITLPRLVTDRVPVRYASRRPAPQQFGLPF